MKLYLRACAEINLDAVAYNFRNIKKTLDPHTKVMPVIKTDAYGHGAIPIAKILEADEKVWGFATSTLEEAIMLKKAGITKPVLVMGFVFPDGYEDVVKYEIRLAAFKLRMAEQLSEEALRQGKTVYLHMALDTGMSRIGFKDQEESIETIEKILQLPNVKMEGIFTHFSKADEKDKTSSKEQLQRYLNFVQKLKEKGIDVGIQHCSNSAAIFDIPEANLDLVRAGIALYGMYPSEEVNKFALPITPVLSLKSRIIFIKEIEAGTEVSYGGTFVAKEKMKIATIPVGYGDGYPRSLSNKGWVLIHGKQAAILGKICMDQFMVDVTHIPEAKEGDMVVLVGSDGGREITMEDLGELSGRFNYELACDFGKRIPRRFWKDGQIVATQDYFECTGIEQE